MCLIFISFHQHPNYPLIVAGNRDEFYTRKTAAASFWEDSPGVLAGRDLEGGGTWMGVTRSGRISMLTNYRDPQHIDPSAPSRGGLVSNFLKDNVDAEMYLNQIATIGKSYNGFNLIVGDQHDLGYYSNYGDGVMKLSPGFYGLSNHLLETPWPKVVRGKQKMDTIIQRSGIINPEDLFTALYDDQQAGDANLPNTGLSLERERALSSIFIKTENYGSRCSTVLLVDNLNHALFAERVYDTRTFAHTTRSFQLEF